MSANVTNQISGSSGSYNWTSPFNFCGPVLFEMTGDQYTRSALAIAPPRAVNQITASNSGLIFNHVQIIASGGSLNQWRMTYWDRTAAYLIVSGTGTWKSPPGNSGPLLWYSPDYISSSFAGQNVSSMNQLIVSVASVGSTGSYPYTTISGTLMTLVWWP